MQLHQIAQLLALVVLANGTPIVAKKIFGPRFSARCSSDVGSSRPSVLALLRLSTRSNLTARLDRVRHD
jgi:hypothetical protein